MTLNSRHLLGIADLTPDEIALILDTAGAMTEIAARPIKKVPTLRGRTVVNLFFEPSTRTRTSFEVAEKRLSADTLSIAVAQSSVTKGETLLDTVRNLEAMAPDMIVMRHSSSGAPHLLARLCRSVIINAGDGMHEHPTQALLDAFTIREHKQRLDRLKIAIVGDLLHSRDSRWAAPDEAWRSTMTSGAIASMFSAVSTSVSPLSTLEAATAMFKVSALRRFSAISNEVRVRVLGS